MHPEVSQARHCDLYAKVNMLQSERVSEYPAFLNQDKWSVAAREVDRRMEREQMIHNNKISKWKFIDIPMETEGKRGMEKIKLRPYVYMLSRTNRSLNREATHSHTHENT